MKPFLFSGRFSLPFFIAGFGHIAWFCWQFYTLYGSDFEGKGYPLSIMIQWQWHQVAGSMLTLIFLLAWIIGTTYFSLRSMKKDRQRFKPFSPVNLLLVFIIACAGFIHSSFYEPIHNYKSRTMLSSIVYSRTYDEYKVVIKNIPGSEKRVEMMTVPELFKKRTKVTGSKSNENPNLVLDVKNKILVKNINRAIAGKFSLPLVIILFYVIGIFMGMSFYKAHPIFPLLISYFLVFGGWYYSSRLFESWFKSDQINPFWSAFGPALLVGVLLTGWYFGLKGYGAFKKNRDDIFPDISNNKKQS